MSNWTLRLFCCALFTLLLSITIPCQAQNSNDNSLTYQSPSMQNVPKILLAHFMVSFGTPQSSGQWKGWNYSNEKVQHDPNKTRKSGQREIASKYYPLIGPYDMNDPEVIEYHCQLLKMSGIDGAVFNLGFFNDPTAPNNQQAIFSKNVMKRYNYYFKKYGLKSVVNYEDKVHWYWNQKLKNRKAIVHAAYDDMEKWLALLQESYLTINHKKVLCFFQYHNFIKQKGVSCLSPNDITQWLSRTSKNAKTILLSQQYNSDYRNVLNGYFEWPTIRALPAKQSNLTHYNNYQTEKSIWKNRMKKAAAQIKYNHCNFIMGGVWPGFNDKGCQGWSKGHRIIPRYNGKTYAFHWKRVIQADYPIVQIATWNDWFEGTIIEPSEEFGYHYLEMTRKYAALWKQKPISPANLRLPYIIYTLRQNEPSQEILQITSKASRAIQKGRFQKAEKLLAKYLSATEFASQHF